MTNIVTHPSSVTQDTLPASVPPKAGRPWHLRKLDAHPHVRAIGSILEAADTVLGIVDPSRQPSTYRELAERVLGELDPHIRSVADFRACEVMLKAIEETMSNPRMDRVARTEALRQAMRKAVIHRDMTLEGRLPQSYIDARLVDSEGRVR